MTERLTNVDMDNKMIDKHAETTQGWDVMCSYDISTVNKVIAKEHIKNPVIANTSFSFNKFFPVKYTESFDIKFGNPTVNFLAGQSGSCEFLMPVIEGSKVTTTDDSGNTKTIDFPLGYSVAMTVPLANVSGDTVNESGKVITFRDKKDQSVVLHFDTKSGIGDTIAYQPPASTDMDKSILDDFVTGFKDNIQDVDYCITTVKSQAQAADRSSGLALTPKSFIFTSQVQDSDSSTDKGGALNVWIQTNESGNDVGIHPNPVFQIGSDRYFPIPQNCTANIFFSKQLIVDKFFIPSLSKAVKKVTEKVKDDVGISLALEPNNYQKDFETHTDSSITGSDTFSCDSIIVDYSKNPIYTDFARQQIKYGWTWSQVISYKEARTVGGAYSSSSVEEGKVKFTGKIDKTQTISDAGDSSAELKIDIAGDDLTITQEHVNEKLTVWDNLLGYNSFTNESLERSLNEDLADSFKGLNIDFGALNYFAEANIIFTEQVFTASDLSINGDVMLVGDIG